MDVKEFLNNRTIHFETDEEYITAIDSATGVASQGETVDEAIEMLKEAVELFLED